MNHKSPMGLAEPLMKSSAHLSAGMLVAAERVRECQKEGLDHLFMDYKTLFEHLQGADTPQDALAVLNDHLQTRFAHSVKTWNDMRHALTTNQSSMLALAMDSMQTESKKLSREINQESAWMMDPVASTLNQFNQMASAMMPGDGSAQSGLSGQSSNGTSHKAAPSKPARSHSSHRSQGGHGSGHSAHASRNA